MSSTESSDGQPLQGQESSDRESARSVILEAFDGLGAVFFLVSTVLGALILKAVDIFVGVLCEWWKLYTKLRHGHQIGSESRYTVFPLEDASFSSIVLVDCWRYYPLYLLVFLLISSMLDRPALALLVPQCCLDRSSLVTHAAHGMHVNQQSSRSDTELLVS